MYQALYRKWRPQTFDEVVGQQHITETLKNQVINGRLSHAYLFIGTRGTGKTTCARILAKAVNCEHPVNGNPCGVCPACQGISSGSVLDVVELDAASNNSVDNVRALREEAVFTPAAVRKRVYIIDEVHMLSGSAFNALLKILEEPPEHLMFILATTELQKVPATILSRCQRHSFKRIDAPVIADYLKLIAEREDFSLTDDAADLIARLADGGVRDALSLLDQCSAAEKIDLEAVYSAMGLAGNRRTTALMEHIISHRTDKALKEFSSLWMDGKDPAVLLSELNALLRDSLMVQVAPRGSAALLSGGYEMSLLHSLAERMTKEEILCAMETLQKAMGTMRLSADPKITAELCLVSLCDNTLGESISQLRARVSRLEEQLKNGVSLSSALDRGATPEQPSEAELRTDPVENFVPKHEEASEEDDLDPAVFAEEQPEDSFLLRTDKVKTPGNSLPEEKTAEGLNWRSICEKASGTLPRDIFLKLENSREVRGHIDGALLKIEVAPGFLYGRFNRPDILAKFSDAASELAGYEIRAVISELEDKPRDKRSLEELKQFKEVRFI